MYLSEWPLSGRVFVNADLPEVNFIFICCRWLGITDTKCYFSVQVEHIKYIGIGSSFPIINETINPFTLHDSVHDCYNFLRYETQKAQIFFYDLNDKLGETGKQLDPMLSHSLHLNNKNRVCFGANVWTFEMIFVLTFEFN